MAVRGTIKQPIKTNLYLQKNMIYQWECKLG